MTLFSLIFYPSGITVNNIIDCFLNLYKISDDIKILGEGSVPFRGLYPWNWVIDEEKNFKSLQGGLLVAPILQKLIMDREPEKVIDWVNTVVKWDIKQIIPSHMENNVKSSSLEFSNAFDFLDTEINDLKGPKPNYDDFYLLIFISNLFTKLGIVAPSIKPSQVKNKIIKPKNNNNKNKWIFF